MKHKAKYLGASIMSAKKQRYFSLDNIFVSNAFPIQKHLNTCQQNKCVKNQIVQSEYELDSVRYVH